MYQIKHNSRVENFVFGNIPDYLFNRTNALSNKRLAWIDYAKGIAIFLVIYHHAFLGLLAAGLPVNKFLINLNMAVYSFRVPLFFILSGLFISQGLKKRGLEKYLKYRGKILLYPYLLWAILQVSFGFFFRSYSNFPWGPKLFLFILYEPKYTGQLWYLLALFNASAIYSLLTVKCRLKKTHHLLLGLVLYLLAPALSFNSLLQQLSIFYIYLIIGTLLSNSILSGNLHLESYKRFVILLPIFVVSQIYFLRHENMDPFFISYKNAGLSANWLLNSDIKMIKYLLIVLIGCSITINLCFILQRWQKMKIIRLIGFHSLYIYIMHIILIVTVRTIFIYILNYRNTFVILPTQVILAALISIVLYNICKNSGLNWLFEFDANAFKTIFQKFQHQLKIKNV